MSKKNKCVGLDCEMCGNTKCPNEEKEKIIDGIDVSECAHLDEWKHCNICEELIKTISDRHQCVTEQDLRCEYYSDCYFKQLKRLQQELDIKEKMLDKFMIGSGETLEKLQKENEGLKEKNKELLNLCNNGGALLVTESAKTKKYKKALEEIREKCLKMCNICDNIDGETYLDDCNSICEYCKIIDLINEVLNE